MAAAATAAQLACDVPAVELTLLDLVWAVSEAADSEAEVVATVLHLIESGRVRLCGSFRGAGLARA